MSAGCLHQHLPFFFWDILVYLGWVVRMVLTWTLLAKGVHQPIMLVRKGHLLPNFRGETFRFFLSCHHQPITKKIVHNNYHFRHQVDESSNLLSTSERKPPHTLDQEETHYESPPRSPLSKSLSSQNLNLQFAKTVIVKLGSYGATNTYWTDGFSDSGSPVFRLVV